MRGVRIASMVRRLMGSAHFLDFVGILFSDIFLCRYSLNFFISNNLQIQTCLEFEEFSNSNIVKSKILYI
jgi:hypothetical protein